MLHLFAEVPAFLPKRLLQLGKTKTSMYEKSIVGKLPVMTFIDNFKVSRISAKY